MPKVDPMQYLMSALSTLTGGLIADMQTLILGMVVITFIAMAADFLFSIFAQTINAAQSSRFSNAASSALHARDSFTRGSHDWNLANLKYKKLLNRAVDHEIKGSSL